MTKRETPIKGVVRNALFGIALVAASILAVAVLDGAFRFLLPNVSERVVGSTDVATYAQWVTESMLFALAGFLARRWLRGPWGVAWLVLPVAALYVAAILQAPYAYQCRAGYAFACFVANSPFLIAIVASVVGYFVLRGSSSREPVV